MLLSHHAPTHRKLSRKGRIWLIISLTIPIIILTFIEPPIAQDPSYHQFADRRAFLGIPNFYNVISNAAFLVVGIIGLAFLQGQYRLGSHRPFLERREEWPYFVLFLSVLLTSFGSTYYHLNPNDAHLVLDRLPMTFGFMAFFAATIMERINVKVGLWLLPPLILLGVSSVIYWYTGDLRGGGDLRFYVDIQFYPLLAIPLIVSLFPPRYLPNRVILFVILLYALAKLFEVWDRQIFDLLDGWISGHSLKHLTAALATYIVVWILGTREPADQIDQRERLMAGKYKALTETERR